MQVRSVRPLVLIAALSAIVFVALTVLVTTSAPISIDSRAFRFAHDLRAPWLDHVARAVTTFGLIAIVGPALLVSGVLLMRAEQRARAAALLTGGALAWIGVWLLKLVVDRPRPSAPLVTTSGQSYPSGHAANSVGWLALAIALTVLIRSRAGRVAAVCVAGALTVLVGLSRIYLRAHYASDVLGGESFAVATYALTATAAYAWWPAR